MPIFLIAVLGALIPYMAVAAPATYTLLAPLGPLTGAVTLPQYLQGIMLVTVGVAGILAVVMIVICGIQIIGSPSVSQRSASKECIWNAIFGLLLAAGSWIILNTINSDLLKNEANLGDIGTPAPITITAKTEPNPADPGWYFKYSEVATGNVGFIRAGTGDACEQLRENVQADPTNYNVLSPCYEVKAGSGATPVPPPSTPPPRTTGVTCPQSGLNLCEPQTRQCANPNCARFASLASRAASRIGGGASANLIKAVILQESSCGLQLVGDGGDSCGPMHIQPATAAKHRSKCGIAASTIITCGWLSDEANWEASICLAAAELDVLSRSACGPDVRNIAAGYNAGPGRCAASANCSTDRSCDGSAVKQWECLYDDNAHTRCNTGFFSTRNYATKVLYCTNNPGF